MKAALRVWLGSEDKHRRIVAARSRMRAIALLDTTPEKFHEWFTETRDPVDLSVADREGVWDSVISPGRRRVSADFKPWRPPALKIVYPSWQACGLDESEN